MNLILIPGSGPASIAGTNTGARAKGQPAIAGVEPVIAIERRDDLDHRRRRAHVAALELGVERAKHLAQPRDVDVGVAVGGVKSPLADGPVDAAAARRRR